MVAVAEAPQETLPLPPPSGFLGAPYANELYVIHEGFDSRGIRILASTSVYEQAGKLYTGIDRRKFWLLTPDAAVTLLPTNSKVADTPDFIAEQVSESDIVMVNGDGNPGPWFIEHSDDLDDLDYSMFSAEQDDISHTLIDEAMEQGKKILAVDRGFFNYALHLGLTLQPNFWPEHDEDFMNKEDDLLHVAPNNLVIPELERVTAVAGKRTIQVSYPSVDQQLLWKYHRTYVHSVDQRNAVQTLIGLDRDNNVGAAAFVWHPEKLPAAYGYYSRQAIQKIFTPA